MANIIGIGITQSNWAVIGRRTFIGFETVSGEMANSGPSGIVLLIVVFFHYIVVLTIGVSLNYFDGIGVLANLEFANFGGVTVVIAVISFEVVTGVSLNS